jgi:hypothetical protein
MTALYCIVQSYANLAALEIITVGIPNRQSNTGFILHPESVLPFGQSFYLIRLKNSRKLA